VNNGTCTTDGNKDGKKSNVVVLESQGNNSDTTFANYDQMAQKAYVIIEHSMDVQDSGIAKTITGLTSLRCMANKDFAGGSRVPDAMKKNKEPANPTSNDGGDDKKGAATMLRASSWFYGIVVVGALFLST
jgi:hypothetical protein